MSASNRRGEKLLYFPHIPKCGGTTIKRLINSAVGRANCLRVWNKDFGGDVSREEFVTLGKAVFETKKAIVGHLPLGRALSNEHLKRLHDNGELKTFTIVRDPIDRRISLYNYMRSWSGHPRHEKIKEVDPIEFILHPPWNFQSDYLRESKDEPVESILQRIAVFPIDGSELSIRRWLEIQIGQKLSPASKANVTSVKFPDLSHFKRSLLTSDQISFLKSKHDVDFCLFRKCKEDFQRSSQF